MISAYSYIRFSSDQQEEGDSIRRQEALRDAWLKRHPDVKLAATYTDRGVSGYSGKHVESGELGKLLALVKRGRVPAGSYLLVENLDRLSRLGALRTLNLVSELTEAGVNVVTLQPEKIIPANSADDWSVLTVAFEAMRSRDESKRKSDLINAACSEKKRAAREKGTPKGGRIPFWLEVVGAKRRDYSNAEHRIKPEAAEVVRRAYQLALTKGVYAITKELNEEKALGRNWAPSTVRWVLHTRAAIGEYQPLKGGKPDGDPVVGYFPAVVNEKQWYTVQEVMKARDGRCGRPTKQKVQSIFSGIARCAIDQCPMNVVTNEGKKYIVSSKAKNSQGGNWNSFPLDVFQTAVLKELRELKAADLFSDPGAGRVAEVQGRLTHAETRLKRATEEFDKDPDNETWPAQISKYDKLRRELLIELADAQQEAANPLSATWSEVVAERDPERIRSGLLLTVDAIHCVVVKVGATKLCAAQVRFKGDSGIERSYLITCPRGAEPTVRSLRRSFGQLDFTQPADVSALVQMLRSGHCSNSRSQNAARSSARPSSVASSSTIIG